MQVESNDYTTFEFRVLFSKTVSTSLGMAHHNSILLIWFQKILLNEKSCRTDMFTTPCPHSSQSA